MVSFKTTGIVAAAALATLAQADYQIDPSTVPLATRQRWCRDEKLTCPLICQQTEPRTTLVNDCDPETLQYGCLCGDNKQPNVSEYSLSMPYYVCTEWGRQCVAKCNNNNVCASDCLQNHPCGATNPQRQNASATSTQGATATQTGSDGLYTGPPGSSSDKKTGAGSALEAGRSWGFAVVFVGMFAGFAML
ncbi:hypothetical protein ISF_05264 [Cordyceps fumosorosea ARSEF 2679]|uniref:DUF7707 domain-containing protein n=1 Tax=Cordyceps fumosorosea (strain ARSEF 2679) TaxID=1081104 RepID=A0A167V5T1_CORFA|nr:hypothetical protein ISF_05264 [Cordyceps fumosorosea ARSEF 2679]OAA62255.1 hypothetical protein ISF_05264 [Cordyceps fumosorosea ARSEF 2679]